jgi:hypothetical protein
MNKGPLVSYAPAVWLLAAACTTTPAIPETLAPAGDSSFAMLVPAKGVQIYECANAKAGGFEWAFVAPDADLLDTRGQVIGHHGAGPYWKAADGSRVMASVKAKANAPADGAIPWLLLSARNDGPAGAFSGVVAIQRVNTRGGLAPADGCGYQTVGQRARMPYTADYRFFTSNTKGNQHVQR